MSEFRKTYGDGVFYLTFTIVGWMDVFTRPTYTKEIVDSLKFCQQRKGLEIYAYVIMTNHLHLIARRADGELVHAIRDFKSFTAKRLLNLLLENSQESRKDWMDMVFKHHAATIRQNEKYAFCYASESGLHPPKSSAGRICERATRMEVEQFQSGESDCGVGLLNV